MNSRISIYTPPFSKIKSYYEMVDIAEKYGLNAETINLMELSEPDVEFAKKLKSYADARNVRFTCVSAGLNLVGENAEEMIERAKRYADVASILGSPYLHHTIAFDIFNPQEVIGHREEYLKRGTEAVAEIFDYAATVGVTTLHEDQGFVFNGVDGIKAIGKMSGRKTGVVADFGNILFDDTEIQDFIPFFADSIANVHLKDYKIYPKGTYEKNDQDLISKRGNKLVDCALGEGAVDFDRGFEELEKIGYNGYIAIECPSLDNEEQTFENNIKFIERYLNK